MIEARINLTFKICLLVGLVHCTLPALAQDCDVDFPGIVLRNFSTTCGGPSASNLTLGKNTYMGTGDVFIFNLPVVNISGNISVNAQGSGKIVIPAGVTLNVAGNFQLDSKNSGCTSANPCIFEIEVNGTANFSGNFQNNLVTVIWSGTGTVVVDDSFENSSNGCMDCGILGCPDLQFNSGCNDNGSGCFGGDFCDEVNACASDITPPAITGCPTNISVSLSSGCSTAVSWTAPTATDNCGDVTLTSTHNPGHTFAKGTTLVTYTATDDAGNTATCSFNVTVDDAINPVITGCPSNITVSANASCQATVNWTAPTVSDNCGGTLTLTTTKNPATIFNVGTTVVTYTATDAAGNTSTCSFNVTVQDNTNPVIAGCPSNITVSANASCEATVNWTAPTVSDNCAGTLTLTTTKNPGTIFNLGTTIVTYTATDQEIHRPALSM
jgi:HYR domain